MTQFTTLTSRVVVLPMDNIDTDQIIPARFLKTTDKSGLGANLFADWRYRADGSPNPDFILNRPQSQGARVLLAGHNFGCGSSREHAPWALVGFGIQVVISTTFADIFRNNALKNGLLPIVVGAREHQLMMDLFTELPHAELTINLAEQSILLPNGETIHFPIDGFSKTCLLNGVDELGYLMKMEQKISEYESKTLSG